MTTDLKSLFEGIDKAKVTERGNPQTPIEGKREDGSTYTSPADYDLLITSAQMLKTREGWHAFIVNVEVLASNNPMIKVGDKSRTWFQGFKDPDVAKSSVKAFALAVLGIELSDVDEVNKASASLSQLLELACGKEQVFANKKVHVRVDQITTKKNSKLFNRHTFSPYKSA